MAYYEHLAHEFGVEKVHLGRDPEIAGNIVQGLQQVVSAGGERPKEIIVSEFHPSLVDRLTGQNNPKRIGTYTPATKVMAFNPKWEGWNDPHQAMADLYSEKWFSSKNPMHAVYHESAHAHLIQTKTDHDQERFTSDEDFAIASTVSRYATKNKDEFLAEVRAAKMAGRRVEKDVKDLYERLGGDDDRSRTMPDMQAFPCEL